MQDRLMTIANLLEPARLRRAGDAPRLPVMPRTLSVIAITASTLAAVALAPAPLGPLSATIALWLPALAWSDIDAQRLPDALTRPMTICALLIATLTAVVTDNYFSLGRGLLVAAITALVMALMGLLISGGPGLGDAKTAPALLLPLGWTSITLAAAWALTALALAAIWGILQLTTTPGRAGTHVPFGPAMISAWFICLALI